MEITRPQYYDTFRCLAGACPDSCCKDWAVQVDEASARRYRALPGELGDRLRQAMVLEDGETILALEPDGRCPMWRDDGLCRIQAALGEEALCQTCHTFPRLRHDYGDFVELGLELSCPEAARLILTGDDAVVTQQVPGGEAPEYDGEAMAILRRSRAEALRFLNDRSYGAGEALAILLLYGYSVQNELDGGELARLDPAADLLQARSVAGIGDMAGVLQFYRELEILTDQWRRRLDGPKGSRWSEAHRTLARYFVSRYWLQAVSDLDLVGRVKLVLCSCLVIKALGGDVRGTAQLYSKEIENDADNIDAILDGAYASPALTDTALLGLLLED